MFLRSLRVTKYAAGILLVGLATLVSCKKEDPKSNLAGLTAFSIKDLNVPFTIDETQRIIQNADSLPFQTDVSAYVANFTAVPLSTVKVGGVAQVSGTTVNDFSEPLQYDVVAEDGVTTRSYTVRVNVAQIDPNGLAWQRITSNADYASFHDLKATYFNNKFYALGANSNSTNGSYSSVDGTAWTTLTAKDNNDLPIPSYEHGSLITFKNKMWLLGGLLPDIGFNFGKGLNDIWSSSDGVTWQLSQAGTSDRWAGRERASSVVFKDKLWIFGGSGYPNFSNTDNTGNTVFKDIWNSTDGTTWTKIGELPGDYINRADVAMFVYKDKLWVAGGWTKPSAAAGNFFNDIWNSADGVTWTKVNTQTVFTPRGGFQVIVHNDQLLAVGGETVDGIVSEIWSSEDDGVNWHKVEAGDSRALPNDFPAKAFYNLVKQDENTFWILGGLGPKDMGTGKYAIAKDIWKVKLN